MNVGFLFAGLAGTAAVTAEYLYKTWEGPWWTGLYMWIPIQLTIGYCVYRMVNLPGTNLLDAFILFALATALLRVVLAICILGQTVPLPSWVGFGLVLLATLVKTFWRV